MRTITIALPAFVVLFSAGGRLSHGDELLRRVEQLSNEAARKVLQWRRDFHAHPELSNREQRTARVVAEHLRELGVDRIKTGVARHGVVALIRGREPGPTVALRADMDALPIQEETGLAFASQNDGVMHACGHDAHTAILLGAANVLVQMRDAMPGSVKLIFQPAEEGTPAGEEGGATLMIEEGVLRDPEVSAIFGLHVSTELETGKIGYRYGCLLASVDRFRVTITGKQSHAAMPWQGADPIVASAHVITAIQTVASRKIDARQPVVVSIGILRAGQAWNIIPQQVAGFYVFLGVRNESLGAVHPVHTPKFTLDEAALPLGVRALTLMALEYLRTESVVAQEVRGSAAVHRMPHLSFAPTVASTSRGCYTGLP